MREENVHVGGKWETMNFLGVALQTRANNFCSLADMVSILFPLKDHKTNHHYEEDA